MRPVLVVPSYWTGAGLAAQGQFSYDHATALNDSSPELERCLNSLERAHITERILLLVVCPLTATAEVAARVRSIVQAHAALNIVIITNDEARPIMERVSQLAPRAIGEGISLRGYGAIRNMGLAAASILGHDAVLFIDDDELITDADFVERGLYGLNQETRQRRPIIAKTGYFYNSAGSPLADTTKAGPCYRWWTKRIEFNRWMRAALAGTRISRSNHVCGGCMALSARAYMRVAFDPYITRGEDLDYLFNLMLFGYDMWFDNQWSLWHEPPAHMGEYAGRFMQDVYRWVYEREKLAFAARQREFNQVTPAALMPYPGPWLTEALDERIQKTALIRSFLTSEHRAYAEIWRHGLTDAKQYARENAHRYLAFQRFWPTIMNGLWGDAKLGQVLLGA
ncbi:glycosyltransferase [Collinsella sp. zg1085]|uniref:glycosyltransferase family 2 protein n=1 Tax=Collinsella sp. zg1085 TaxID=2844380 RepID=UPI001C0C15E6|nr:glycosyltransferase [Collinsella sp. zg1085]QWT17574.1 glycosyltransferase [Collinsella sp. zg1085]